VFAVLQLPPTDRMVAVRYQIGVLAAVATTLAACSASTPVAPERFAASPPTRTSVPGGPPPTAAPAGPTPNTPVSSSVATAAASLLAMGYDFSHPIHIPGSDCEPPTWGGRPSLPHVLGQQPNLAAAAIMTVVGPTGPAQWNTTDGHRWTQPEAIAARLKGVIPAIQQPWKFVRSGQTFVGSVPDSVQVWMVGGRVGDDYMFGGNCIAGASEPLPGQSYLMFFGPTQDLAPPGAYRVILAAPGRTTPLRMPSMGPGAVCGCRLPQRWEAGPPSSSPGRRRDSAWEGVPVVGTTKLSILRARVVRRRRRRALPPHRRPGLDGPSPLGPFDKAVGPSVTGGVHGRARRRSVTRRACRELLPSWNLRSGNSS
jgi:hypothetical protein